MQTVKYCVIAIVRSVGFIIGGLYLLALYFFTVWASVGSLSAIQIKDEVFEQHGGTVTFADVGRAKDRLLKAESRIYDDLYAKDFIWIKSQQVDEVLYHLAAFFREQKLSAPVDQVSLVGDGGNNVTETAEYDYWQLPQTEQFGELAVQCRNVQDAPGCLLYFEYERLNYELDELYSEDAQTTYSEEEARADEKLASLRAGEPLVAAIDIQAFFERIPLYNTFLDEPRSVLVLQLTMVMGMLGSVVTMTWSFVRRDRGLTIRRFLVLPFVGSMSAFIILVLLKAGQISMTGGSTEDELSPFFLSFVGIISGLMSENAYSRIAAVGSNFFQVGDPEELRFGVGLKKAMVDEGQSVSDLATFIGVTEEEADALVEERAPATRQQQRLISAFVRRPTRELFTDVEPPEFVPRETSVQVEVPTLVGQSEEQISGLLSASGLKLGASSFAFDVNKPEGTVISQTPAPRCRVAPGSKVDVIVSKGTDIEPRE